MIRQQRIQQNIFTIQMHLIEVGNFSLKKKYLHRSTKSADLISNMVKQHTGKIFAQISGD